MCLLRFAKQVQLHRLWLLAGGNAYDVLSFHQFSFLVGFNQFGLSTLLEQKAESRCPAGYEVAGSVVRLHPEERHCLYLVFLRLFRSGGAFY